MWIGLDKNSIKFDKNVIVGIIYRMPGQNMGAFNTYLAQTYQTIMKENKMVYHLGDYNINL